MFFNPQPASACFILWGRGGKADDPARSRIERAAQVFAFLLFVATDTTIALAQPGPFTTFRNSNLVFAATTLLTNGVPGLTDPPAKLMVSRVANNSAQGGRVSLVVTQAWAKRYNGPANNEDQANGVVVDGEGNMMVAGYSFGLGTSSDFTTIKYRPDGTAIWTNRYDGLAHGSDRAFLIALDGANNIYVSGESGNSTGGRDLATIKYSTDGIPIWTNLFGGSGGGFLFSVGLAVDAAGNTYLSPYDFDHPAYIILKYDTSGNPAWTNYFNGSLSSMDTASGIALDDAGNVFITGSSLDPGGNVVTLKFTPEGTGLWTNRYNGPSNASDNPRGIGTDLNGAVYVTGTSSGSGSGFGALDFATVKYANNLRYSPPTNFIGTDTFTFVAVDHAGNSATGTVTVAVLPLTLQFNTANLQFTTEGMRLQVYGARGTNAIVMHVSTDLVNWSPIFTNPPALGSVQFLHSTATNFGQRYFRAVQP